MGLKRTHRAKKLFSVSYLVYCAFLCERKREKDERKREKDERKKKKEIKQETWEKERIKN